MRVVDELVSLQREAEAAGRRCVVAAVIVDDAGRVFVPRRVRSRVVLPGIWDLVGGHVEDGETLLDALHREVTEETGWTVTGAPMLVYVGDWPYHALAARREFDFLVRVDGDPETPVLAPAEHDEFRWITPDEIGVFDENSGADGGMLRRVVESAWHGRVTGRDTGLVHVTILVASGGEQVEELRRRWDPVTAAQVPAHVTVAYPHELAGAAATAGLLDRVVGRLDRFHLVADRLVHDVDPAEGIFLRLLDPTGGWGELRHRLVGPGPTWPPHITLVHPRTSGLGPAAWTALEHQPFDTGYEVDAVAVTAFDGHRWNVVHRCELS